MHRLGYLLIATLLFGGFCFNAPAYAQEDKTLDERMSEIDVSDPDQLYTVAIWAMKHKKSSKYRKEGRKLMKEILELDEDHELARAAFGHVRVGDKWYTSKKSADKARVKLLEEEMKEKGYVPFKGGFIKKVERRNYKRNWEKGEDLIWRSYEETMRRKGYQLYQGEWLRVSKNDADRAQRHTKLTGEDIVVVSTEHFVLHLQIPVNLVKHYSELVEKLYAWFYKEFEADKLVAKDKLFPHKPHLWGFNSPQQFQDWVTTYSEEYRFTKEDKEDFRKRPGGRLDFNRCLSTVVNEKAEDMENGIIHQIAVLTFMHFVRGRAAPWMFEAVGNLAEHHLSKEKYGFVTMSTKTKYGGGGGIAGKDFNTKDMPPQVKGIVKRVDYLPILQLSLLGLNSLNEDHLAQGFSHMEWMFNHKRSQLVSWIHHLRTGPFPGAAKQKDDQRLAYYVQECIKHAFQWSPDDFMENWQSYVRKNYR